MGGEGVWGNGLGGFPLRKARAPPAPLRTGRLSIRLNSKAFSKHSRRHGARRSRAGAAKRPRSAPIETHGFSARRESPRYGLPSKMSCSRFASAFSMRRTPLSCCVSLVSRVACFSSNSIRALIRRIFAPLLVRRKAGIPSRPAKSGVNSPAISGAEKPAAARPSLSSLRTSRFARIARACCASSATSSALSFSTASGSSDDIPPASDARGARRHFSSGLQGVKTLAEIRVNLGPVASIPSFRMMADQDRLAERDDIGHLPRSGQARLAFRSQGARARLKALFARGLSSARKSSFF